MPRTKWRDMAAYQIAVPTAEIAERHTGTIYPIVQKIFAAITESRTLTLLRDALLPKLLSGELRASDAEKIGERGV